MKKALRKLHVPFGLCFSYFTVLAENIKRIKVEFYSKYAVSVKTIRNFNFKLNTNSTHKI